MALHDLKNVVVLSSVQELLETLFKDEAGDLVIPEPGGCVLFSHDDCDKKRTINDLLCVQGEEALYDMMELYHETPVYLLLVKLDIVRAGELLYHPLLRLQEYPALLTVDGRRRLYGTEVSATPLLQQLFAGLPSQKRMLLEEARALYLRYCAGVEAPTERDLGRVFQPDGLPPARSGLPLELCFWDAGLAAGAQRQAEAGLVGYGTSRKEDTDRLEARIREEFVRETDPALPETTLPDTPTAEQETSVESKQGQLLPVNLEELYCSKELWEVERKPRPVPVNTGTPDKKPIGKKKKGKGKDKKGKGKDKKGKKGKKK